MAWTALFFLWYFRGELHEPFLYGTCVQGWFFMLMSKIGMSLICFQCFVHKDFHDLNSGDQN